MSYLKVMFLFFGFSMSFVGVLVNWFEKYIPSFIVISYKYGKLSKEKAPFEFDRVPKSWFRHFYSFSSVFSFLAFFLLFLRNFNFINGIPEQLKDAITFFSGPILKPSVTTGSAFLSIILMTSHCFRRFYETHYICVYSDSKMNVGIYFVGLLHYFGAIMAIVSEAPGILNSDFYGFSNNDLSPKHFFAGIVFILANIIQYQSAVILGNLRKNKKGEVKSIKHEIPRGKLFEYVSCPHMMCELVIYLCLWTILWGNTTWPYVTAWVIINQVECAIMCHWWYQETFKDYPQERKALIPLIF